MPRRVDYPPFSSCPIIHLRINGAADEQVGIHLLQLVNILGPSSLVVVSGTIFPEWRCSDTKIDRQYNLLILMSDISLGDHKLRRWLPLQRCQKDSQKSVSICSSCPCGSSSQQRKSHKLTGESVYRLLRGWGLLGMGNMWLRLAPTKLNPKRTWPIKMLCILYESKVEAVNYGLNDVLCDNFSTFLTSS